MRIYMLNPPFVPRFSRSMRWQEKARGGTIYYPIWLAYATGLLEKEGHKVRLVDAPANGLGLKQVIDDVERFKAELIVIETSFTSLHNDLRVAHEIKKAHDYVKIVMVGPPTSVLTREILSHNAIDYVAYYEYDWTLKELAKSIEEGVNPQEILGIAYKDSGVIRVNPPRPFSTSKDLDSLPFVSKVYAKHLNIYNYYLSSALYPEAQIFAGRECPFQCTFCAWPQTFMGRIPRLRSTENVIEELKWIKENLPYVKEVVFEDDTFGVNRKWLKEFLNKLIEEKLDIAWSCQIRADLDLETLKLMSKAGCRLVIVGFESANQQILNNIKKGITVEQMKKFAENIKKAGIFLHADFIIGLPGETKETIQQTFQFIKEIKPDILQISIATPFPGTEFYIWLEKNGYLKTKNLNEYLDEHGHQKCIVNYPWLSTEEIEIYVDTLLKKYYLSLSYIPIFLRQILRKHGFHELLRIIRAAKVFLTEYLAHRKA